MTDNFMERFHQANTLNLLVDMHFHWQNPEFPRAKMKHDEKY